MTLFASPWSPPTWMKFPKAYNHGRLIRTPAIQAAYALYFARFIEEYAKQGLVINQLHVQNEPAADQKFPSCLWEGHELRDFIRDHLAPCLARRGLATEIWVGTLNTDDFHGWAETILADPECRRHVAGFGYQWAGKNAVQRHAESFPDVPFAQTENECGDGANTWPYALYVFDLIRHYLANDAAFYTYWNLVLKPGGVSTWGWRQNSMVSIDDAGKVTWNPEYWIFRHCATAIRPGARRLGIDGPWRGAALAFANPDGTTGLVVANHLAQPRTLAVAIDHTTISLELPARSIATLVVE
jgi:glucosylceramidase